MKSLKSIRFGDNDSPYYIIPGVTKLKKLYSGMARKIKVISRKLTEICARPQIDVIGDDLLLVKNSDGSIEKCIKLNGAECYSPFTFTVQMEYVLCKVNVHGTNTVRYLRRGVYLCQCFDKRSIEVDVISTGTETVNISRVHGYSNFYFINKIILNTRNQNHHAYINIWGISKIEIISDGAVYLYIRGIPTDADDHFIDLSRVNKLLSLNDVMSDIAAAEVVQGYIVFSAGVFATLTPEQIAVATAKGWTVVSK